MCYRSTQSELKIIREFKSHHGNECYLCHKKITPDELITVDHKLPVSRSGKTVSENLAICCASCNSEKSDMTEKEYEDYLINKQYILNNNEILKTFDNMLKANADVIKKLADTQKLLISKINEKVEIENCISDVKFNASEGYVLCRDLKKVLLEIRTIKKEVSRMQKIQPFITSQKDKLQNAYNDMADDIMKDIRGELGLGHLKDKEIA